jgi:hypothetical protein
MKYSGSNLIVLEFGNLLGDQVPTTKGIERNPTNVLKVYSEMLGYYKDLGDKKTPGKSEYHPRKSLKKKKPVLQKRGMGLFKWCFKYIQKLHPKLSKKEVHDVMKGINDEEYSDSNSIVLHY